LEPAVEDQATDRAHRIGRRETVHVHHLIAENTVEDHIGELPSAPLRSPTSAWRKLPGTSLAT
jgi:SNF2 family DNA or RNA helicase